MCIVGPSGCGKSWFTLDLLRNHVFQPAFQKIYYFYQYEQPKLFAMFKETIANLRKQNLDTNIEFIQGVHFDLISNLPNDGTRYLLIFDDSCEEISRSREFQQIATAGRHRNYGVIYIKHNLFHKSPLGRDVELQNTHIVLFKSPRDVQQVRVLSKQLGINKDTFETWFLNATNKLYGHFMIDLSPKTVDLLRFSTGFNPTRFYLKPSHSKVTKLKDEPTNALYATNLDYTFP